MSKRSISTLGVLRQAVERGEVAHRTVQEEVRENLIQALRGGGPLFPGIIGYDDTVVPQLVNALFLNTTSFCLAFAVRQRRACCARWSHCSMKRSR